MELLRRIALIAGAALSCWLFFSVSSQPLFGVSAVDVRAEQKGYGGMLPDKAERQARSLPPKAFREKLLGEAKEAGSAECARFVAWAAQASATNGAGMASRLGPDQTGGPAPTLFFAQDELPGDCLSFLPDTGASALLRTGDDQVPLANARRYPTGPDQFHLGSGYARYPSPPSSLLYPERGTAWIALVLGLAVYLVLPRRPVKPGEAHYASGRMILADVLGIGLFLLFFSLPFLIAGGTAPALGEAWPLTVTLWALSLFGAAIVFLDAAFASIRLYAGEDEIFVRGLFGTRRLAYAAISGVVAEVKRPPALLRRGLWLAAMLGGGPALAGMAMLQSSSSPLRLRIETAAGGRETVWLTDQTGNPILLDLRPFLEALDGAKVKGASDVLRRLFGGLQ